jgi:hypothetical protein
MAGLFKSCRGLARTLAPMLSHLATGMPPITVRQSADGYYVVDGRHRVSVALAFGHRDIEAWVIETGSLSSPALAAAA